MVGPFDPLAAVVPIIMLMVLAYIFGANQTRIYVNTKRWLKSWNWLLILAFPVGALCWWGAIWAYMKLGRWLLQ